MDVVQTAVALKFIFNKP